jgi:hypothetical protein
MQNNPVRAGLVARWEAGRIGSVSKISLMCKLDAASGALALQRLLSFFLLSCEIGSRDESQFHP